VLDLIVEGINNLKLYPTLSKPPIKEALIDIRVKLSNDFDVYHLKDLDERIRDGYPMKQEQRFTRVEFQLKPDVEPVEPPQPGQSIAKLNGFRYFSQSKDKIFQARLDGFTFNKLPQYTTWEELKDEAKRLWLLYKEVASPEVITRVALRYINNLNIPGPIRDFGDYLTVPPTMPDNLPQGLNSFLIRMNAYVPDFEGNAIITQALEPMPFEPSKVPVILDIDVFKEKVGLDESEAWELLETLRHFKNEVFFGFITDKLKEVYR
jgi:uncharacterized protein (TIGR04255 family)